MNNINQLRRLVAVLPLLLMLLPITAEARRRAENKLVTDAQAAEARKDWDVALELYKKVLDADPRDTAGQLGLQRSRFEAGQLHLMKGRELRQQGHLEEAAAEFQKGLRADPGSSIHLQEFNTTVRMIQEAKTGPAKPPSEVGVTPAEMDRRRMIAKLRSIDGIPELKPLQRELSTLKMNNATPKVLYETVGKLAGINVIFDPQFQPSVRNANLDLNNTNLDDALDYIALITHTYWKAITSNAIFVTDDNPTKRRDYESVAVKTFYLENPTTPQDFQEIVTAVRSVSDCRRLYTANALNAVIARCTVDQLALVEKLIHDLDKPKPEVLVDVIVLDVNRTHTRDLSASIQAGTGFGLQAPVVFTPGGKTTTTSSGSDTTSGTTTTSVFTLGRLKHLSINDFSTTLPNALLNAVLSDSDTKVLQSPQLRAVDGGKATLNIGSKIPFASGSYQPGIGGVGVNPLVQTNFQYADVGVNITLQPRIHSVSGEISLHVEVDISNVVDHVNFSGLDQPVIGQKKDTTDIRVRDGEVTLLGGLMNTTDSDTGGGIPGLVNIPVLGHFFFGNSHKERDKEELLIAVIPHIVREESLDDVNTRGISAGTEQTVQLRYSHPVETAKPGTSGPAAAPEPVSPPVPTSDPALQGPSAVVPQIAAKAAFVPPHLETHVGNPVIPTLQIENATDVFSAGVRVKWDPKVLRLNSIAPGQFLSSAGQNLNAPVEIHNDTGEATIMLSRLPGAAGVQGSGPLATFSFTAIGPGTSTVTVTELSPRNTKQEAIDVTPPAMTVVVK
ncbi:MAG TPA: cohesin domain-containing protein [Bryobacteraceae bacterium]|nr:cohesin domain-containing protein [Bryobacteraceae bacterium]